MIISMDISTEMREILTGIFEGVKADFDAQIEMQINRKIVDEVVKTLPEVEGSWKCVVHGNTAELLYTVSHILCSIAKEEVEAARVLRDSPTMAALIPLLRQVDELHTIVHQQTGRPMHE